MILDFPIFYVFHSKKIFRSDQFILGGYKWNYPLGVFMKVVLN